MASRKCRPTAQLAIIDRYTVATNMLETSLSLLVLPLAFDWVNPPITHKDAIIYIHVAHRWSAVSTTKPGLPK